MATIHLRSLGQCIGIGSAFSVRRDLFGYRTRFGPLSLLTLAKLLRGAHVHLNIIAVGGDATGAGGVLTVSAESVDRAVQQLRTIYGSVGIGVGRVQHYLIPLVDAAGFDIIESNDEAEDLAEHWYVDNDGMDLFLVLDYLGSTAGLSQRLGECDKEDNDKRMDASVVQYFGDPFLLGQDMAHELGHFMGLDVDGDHNPDPANIMYPTIPNGGTLTGGQGEVMKRHCWIRGGCP